MTAEQSERPPFDLAAFYAALPAKRVAAGALCRDEAGRVLLVEPTYKDVWELPGGLVEIDESPLAACRRELREELGIDLPVHRLLCVDWRPAELPVTEGLMLVFDGGVLDSDQKARITLPDEELRSYAFCSPTEVARRVSPALRRRIEACLKDPDRALYLEHGRPPD